MSNDQDPKIVRVRGGTNSKGLGAFIAGEIERGRTPRVEYIGAGPCNQAIKAIAEANKILNGKGMTLSIVPVFVCRKLKDNPNVSAMQLRLTVTEVG